MNHSWKGKLWSYYHAACKWGAPDHVTSKLYRAIDNLDHGEINTELFEVARLTARLANVDNLSKAHSDPKLTQVAESRWIREIGSNL